MALKKRTDFLASKFWIFLTFQLSTSWVRDDIKISLRCFDSMSQVKLCFVS